MTAAGGCDVSAGTGSGRERARPAAESLHLDIAADRAIPYYGRERQLNRVSATRAQSGRAYSRDILNQIILM